jgi:hypothetical protein
VEMSKSSNKNIQEEVISFLKNWDKIQRNAWFYLFDIILALMGMGLWCVLDRCHL